MGPSPRVRGSPRRAKSGDAPRGSIPACAGEPVRRRTPASSSRVHPRVCGGAERQRARVRRLDGSIPACAGEPGLLRMQADLIRVHPRVCGGACGCGMATVEYEGPSPRVRGAKITMRRFGDARGPSPRVRGSPSPIRPRVRSFGSIPACAGEPIPRRPASRWAGSIPACAGSLAVRRPELREYRVHPRVCGGADRKAQLGQMSGGPSPRVRGSRTDDHRRWCTDGSIPACAGEPLCQGDGSKSMRVHPRVCGGAVGAASNTVGVTGPSPRVRGSQVTNDHGVCGVGSIPACAGEPALTDDLDLVLRVHPRVCGGAKVWQRARIVSAGPSPRVRGSPAVVDMDQSSQGSIPACAGEPLLGRLQRFVPGVHPRVCGGASCGPASSGAIFGPSPRVRGSRRAARRSQGPRGSIPACAGEPDGGDQRRCVQGVHPRVCGGAPRAGRP